MAKRIEKEKALVLRQRGMSYKEILKEIPVSKGTLSLWLRDYPLSQKRLREVRDWNKERIEKYKATRKKQKEVLFESVYWDEFKKIKPLLQNDYLAGLFLYWGEGGKTKESWSSVSNTDPAIIRFFVHWFTKYFGFTQSKMKISLHLYADMDIRKEIHFWSHYLNIPHKQFRMPHIKKSKRVGLSYHTKFNHGTCNLIVGNAILTRKILMGVRVLQDHFGESKAHRRVAQR